MWVLAGAVIVIALALLVATNVQRSSAEIAPTGANKNLRTVTVARTDLEDIIRAPGEVTARTANLTLSASGVVSDVLVKPGTVVKAGQVLVKLDTREAEANLEAAIASQKSAQARLDTVQNEPTRLLNEAQRELKIAQARIDALKTPNSTPDELASAQAAVDAAVYRYNALVSQPNPKDVAAAEANLRAARSRMETLKAGPNEAALREANAKISTADQNLQKVKVQEDDKVKQAELNQKKAQNVFNDAKTAYDDFRKEKYDGEGKPKTPLTTEEQATERRLKLALDQADIDIQATTKALERARSEQIAAVKQAEGLVIEAQAALEKLQAGASQQEILTAQAEVDQAQAAYDRVVAGPGRDEINAAQAEINQARAYLDNLNKGASEKDLKVAQVELEIIQQKIADLNKGPLPSEVNRAKGDLEQAQATVKQIQLKIDTAQLRAPYPAVVDSVNVAVGQSVSPGPAAITLIDLATLNFQARVTQNNVQRITSNLPVRIYFENVSGVREEPFLGLVTKVSFQPRNGAIVSSNATASADFGYPVDIQLDADKGIQTLKPGMLGRAFFVMERRANVLVVPKAAVRRLDVGTVVDVILADGQIVTTPVVTGLANEFYIEIIDNGLVQEGDTLILYGDPGVTLPPLPAPAIAATPSAPLTTTATITATQTVTQTVTQRITQTVTPTLTITPVLTQTVIVLPPPTVLPGSTPQPGVTSPAALPVLSPTATATVTQ